MYQSRNVDRLLKHFTSAKIERLVSRKIERDRRTMAHLLEMIKRNGAAHAGKEDDAPEESDKVPEQKLREEDLVSTMLSFCSLSTLRLIL